MTENLVFFADFLQFSAYNPAIPQPILLKLAPHIATTSPNNLIKCQPDRPRWGRAASQAVGRKRDKNCVFSHFRQFSACNSAPPQPIWLKLAPEIATISPNNPLKFQPDRPRWGRAGSRAVGPNSGKNRIFCPVFDSFWPVTRPYLNRLGQFQK